MPGKVAFESKLNGRVKSETRSDMPDEELPTISE
jgi:hypothetical protein